MNLIRFEDRQKNIRYGELIDTQTARLIRGEPLDQYEITDETAPIGRLLAPLVPTNIIAIGLNYRAHALESGKAIPGHPLVFCKLTSTLNDPGRPIEIPTEAPDEVDYEGELAVVIGKTARNVSEESSLSFLLGYTCANDVTARDCQFKHDAQWTRAKSFDTFCPLGPSIAVDTGLDPDRLAIQTRLNGDLVQDSSTADLIFSVPTLISYLSRQFTLHPGTVILTGTPPGVGFARKPPRFLRPGDTVQVTIEGIGTLENPVAEAR